tara:strand:+ start:2129 stop:2842 length:714 start_codon:yes stop_codon:yes gene_type:complete
MPNPNSNCNVRNPSLLGDSVCDHIGGYNSEDCGYDDGDCCKESCMMKDFTLFCGITGYNCIDPFYINTITPTIYPTELIESYPPTYIPTYHPTYSKTNTPTYSPTIPPTCSPSRIPTISPTIFPTKLVQQSVYINKQDNQGVITVLIILLCSISTLFIFYIIHSRRYYSKSRLSRSQSVTFHNPIYNTSSKNDVDRVIYDEINLNEEYEYDDDDLDSTYSNVHKERLPVLKENEYEC